MYRTAANSSNFPQSTGAPESRPKLGITGRLIGFGLLLAVALAAIWLTDLHLHSARAATGRTGHSAAAGVH